MEITWNSAKDKKNRRKHNVSFKTAGSVFADPDYILIFDREENGEERWHAIGYAGASLLTVVHIVVDEIAPAYRIISAREATNYERTVYENGGEWNA